MVTFNGSPKQWEGGRYLMELIGLSTDEKPIGKYQEKEIANGSTFMSIDTQDVNFYDQANEQWV